MSSTLAFADESEPPATDTSERLRGLELMLRPGFGGASSDSPVRYEPSAPASLPDPGELLKGGSPYGVGFVNQAFLGYRFHPFASFGLRGGYRTASSSALSDGSSNLARSAWDLGLYLRVYPLAQTKSIREYFDPWASVGVEYMHDTQTFQRPIATASGTFDADWTLDHHAVAVPLGIGFDYRLLPRLSVGPSFEYTMATSVAGCAEAGVAGFSSNQFCSNKDPGRQVIKANAYGVWSLGVDLKLTLF